MKIGVTGATGQLGGLVTRQLLLLCAASDVVPLIRNPALSGSLQSIGLEPRVADYDDRPSLDAALTGVDRLLLISSNALGRRVAQHSNVIDAAKAVGVRHVVYTSAPKADTSAMPLAAEHKATEEYLVASGLDYSVLRNNWYTENYAEAIKSAARTGVLAAPSAAGRVASATRADYAAGAAAVLTAEGHEGEVYEFSGDHAWDLEELTLTIAGVTGRVCRLRSVDESEDLVAALVEAGMTEVAAGYFAITARNMIGGALAEATTELSQLLGRPTTLLRDSVAAILR